LSEPESAPSTEGLREWLGTVVKNYPSDYGAGYAVEVSEWSGVYVGRVSASGWQVSDDLLCRLQLKDASHLELRFEKHGPVAGMPNDYEVDAVVVTLVRKDGRIAIQWGALNPERALEPDPDAPPPAKTISELMKHQSFYPSEFIGLPGVSRRLNRLLGHNRAILN
jgi:hypothetical protein